MSRPLKGAVRDSAAEHEMRDQEVLRATRELAAYFKGRRTEREARAALKIIKAFIRGRERSDPRSLRPLPGAAHAAVRGRGQPRKIETIRKKGGSRRGWGQTRDNSAGTGPGPEEASVAATALTRDEND